MERAIAVDVAASALESLRDVKSRTNSAGDLGAGAGVSTDGFDLRNLGIAKMGVANQLDNRFDLGANWQRGRGA